MKKILLITAIVILSIYLIICAVLYVNQEQIIFFPEKLPKQYTFQFDQKFEELSIKTSDNQLLSGLLFKADSSKGLIFYLHGNAGSIASWGKVANTFIDLHYDLFTLDYRGYGKSDGEITSEKQLYEDLQIAYDTLKKRYTEENIIILGYSIGTGPATLLASTNSPKLLILQAPYYSFTDIMQHYYPYVPTFLLKYKLTTNEYMKACIMPILIFHGDKDEVIYYESSLKLQPLFKNTDTLITLIGEGHNGMSNNPTYQAILKKRLAY